MTDLSFWPPTLPEVLAQLPRQVAELLGSSENGASDLTVLEAAAGPLLLVLGEEELPDIDFFSQLDRLISHRDAPTVLVIGDGWIGTDGPGVRSAIAGAGAVALVRSIATRRVPTGRVNIVCAPEGLFGESGSHHGPLAIDIQSADLADVVAFALGDDSSYIDGQVLYANGGRQLFSSLTA
jgi:hypothetical protein